MSTRFRNPLFAAVIIVSLPLINGCSTNKLPGVYRLDIQQGNVITRDMLDQIELGMDRRKVRFVLGTPLLTDTFNENRWDYFYSLKKGSGDRVQRHVSLYFENDLLMRIEGDIRSGPTPEGTLPRTETLVTVPAERRKEGFFSGLIPGFLDKGPNERRAAAATPGEESGGAESLAASGEPAREAAGAEAKPETISAEDRAYLEKLFGDYGKLDSGESRPGAEPAPESTRDRASR